MKTVEKYLKEPTRCPFCNAGPDYIEWGEVTMHTRTAEQDVRCEACGKKWWDVFTLTAYETGEQHYDD